LWPRWMTSAPVAWAIRRKMWIEASWPSNRLVAVTSRILCWGWNAGTEGWVAGEGVELRGLAAVVTMLGVLG